MTRLMATFLGGTPAAGGGLSCAPQQDRANRDTPAAQRAQGKQSRWRHLCRGRRRPPAHTGSAREPLHADRGCERPWRSSPSPRGRPRQRRFRLQSPPIAALAPRASRQERGCPDSSSQRRRLRHRQRPGLPASRGGQAVVNTSSAGAAGRPDARASPGGGPCAPRRKWSPTSARPPRAPLEEASVRALQATWGPLVLSRPRMRRCRPSRLRPRRGPRRRSRC
mmetsp:Transcript_101235/g.321493  ORF Transcript_101235/g.321493 Transcript_101235/m.321493 type:complete len:223 (+) Transcript_101235:855-1523(+)